MVLFSNTTRTLNRQLATDRALEISYKAAFDFDIQLITVKSSEPKIVQLYKRPKNRITVNYRIYLPKQN